MLLRLSWKLPTDKATPWPKAIILLARHCSCGEQNSRKPYQHAMIMPYMTNPDIISLEFSRDRLISYFDDHGSLDCIVVETVIIEISYFLHYCRGSNHPRPSSVAAGSRAERYRDLRNLRFPSENMSRRRPISASPKPRQCWRAEPAILGWPAV